MHGAGVELRVHRGAVLVAHMATYVVAPIAVEHVRSGAVEVGQIVEAVPGDVGVARESYLIAVVAQSAPAVIQHRALLALALHVAEPDVVAPEGVAQSLHLFVGEPLLPVEPPEVYAFVHIGVQIGVEQGFHKPLVATQKLHCLAVGVAVAAGKLGVAFLVGAHTVGGVQVHSGFHAGIVEEFQELLIVGKEALVPVPAGPAATGFGRNRMPVHVHHQHVERYVEALEVAYEVAEVLVAVAPVAAPPVAKGIAWWQRHVAGKAGEALQRLLVVGAVNHKIPVLGTVGTRTRGHPIPVGVAVEQQTARVVNQRPAIAGKQPVLNGHRLVAVHIAVVAVEGAVGAFQIGFLLHARLPDNFCAYCLGIAFNLQVAVVECAATQLIGECHLGGDYREFFARHLAGVLHCGIVAFNCHKTLVVDKLAVGGIFHSHCGFVNQREAHVTVAVNHFGFGCGAGCNNQRQRRQYHESTFHRGCYLVVCF